MERLLGIFMGSALAIAALIIVAGIPELTLDDNRSPIEESRATLPLMPDAGTTSAELAQPTAPLVCILEPIPQPYRGERFCCSAAARDRARLPRRPCETRCV
jgi:hypothetical protein